MDGKVLKKQTGGCTRKPGELIPFPINISSVFSEEWIKVKIFSKRSIDGSENSNGKSH